MRPTRIAAFVVAAGLAIVGLVGVSLATHDEFALTGNGGASADASDEGTEMNGDGDLDAAIGDDEEDDIDVDALEDTRVDVAADADEGTVDATATGDGFDAATSADVDDIDAETNLDDEDPSEGVMADLGARVTSDDALDGTDLGADLGVAADQENGLSLDAAQDVSIAEEDLMASLSNSMSIDADEDRLALSQAGSASVDASG